MKNLLHTPGPWTLLDCANGGKIVRRDEAYQNQIVPTADAYLIASAPDLLEALLSEIKKDKAVCPICNYNCTGLMRTCLVMKYTKLIEQATGLSIKEVLE